MNEQRERNKGKRYRNNQQNRMREKRETKWEGEKTLEKTPTSTPLEVVSEPKPAIATSSKSKDDDGDSEETDLGDDPDKLQTFLEKIESYGIQQDDLSKVIFRGGGGTRSKQYVILQKIAKNLHKEDRSKEFLFITTDKNSNNKHKIKSESELKKISDNIEKEIIKNKK